MVLPKRNAATRNSYNLARTLCLRVEVLVSEQPAHKDRCFADVYGKVDYPIAGVPEAPVIEVVIATEEGRSSLPDQEGDDFFILHPSASDVESNLSTGILQLSRSSR
jgi:hypothetical protein